MGIATAEGRSARAAPGWPERVFVGWERANGCWARPTGTAMGCKPGPSGCLAPGRWGWAGGGPGQLLHRREEQAALGVPRAARGRPGPAGTALEPRRAPSRSLRSPQGSLAPSALVQPPAWCPGHSLPVPLTPTGPRLLLSWAFAQPRPSSGSTCPFPLPSPHGFLTQLECQPPLRCSSRDPESPASRTLCHVQPRRSPGTLEGRAEPEPWLPCTHPLALGGPAGCRLPTGLAGHRLRARSRGPFPSPAGATQVPPSQPPSRRARSRSEAAASESFCSGM